jgi:hypothetical protein
MLVVTGAIRPAVAQTAPISPISAISPIAPTGGPSARQIRARFASPVHD